MKGSACAREKPSLRSAANAIASGLLKNVASVAMLFPSLPALVQNFNRAQFGAARRRIFPDFPLAGRERLLRQNHGLPQTLQLPETFFHFAVLERREGDDDDPSTRLHHSRRGFEQR